MNHFIPQAFEPKPDGKPVDPTFFDSIPGAEERRYFLIITISVILATFSVAIPFTDYARREFGSYLNFLLVTLVLAVYFQRYHEAHCADSSVSFVERQRRKALAWGATFLFATLVLVLTDLKEMPRVLSFSLIAAACLIDILISSVLHLRYPVREVSESQNGAAPDHEKGSLNYRNLFISLGLLVISFATVLALKTDGARLYSHYEELIVVVLPAWLMAAVLTRAFNVRKTENMYYRVAPAWKLGYVTALLVSAFYLYGDFEQLSRGALFGTVLLFTMLQVGLVITRGLLERSGETELQFTIPADAERDDQTDQEIDETPRVAGFLLEDHLPKQVALDGREDLSEFLNHELPRMPAENVTILFSSDRKDFSLLSETNQLLINLEALNSVQNLNPYLATIHKSLRREGYFVTWFYPIDTMARRVRAQMPKSVFVVLYPLYFFVFRVAAKLPVLDRIIFYAARGRQADISKAEVLGRLAFSGFSVLQSRTINERVYVIARANRKPIENTEPSFGPIAKLERIGLHGEKITIYKIRTMYPYSEFIQKDVFGMNGMDDNGKFMNDFRITNLGRVMRKYWIDELPQLYNWIRGDIALVGVRALSRHYFSLYSKDMQVLRLKAKPGLVPPLYADMPRSFTEIVESEKKYILERSRHPLITDMKYLFRAFHNIIFKGARSA